MAKSLDAVLGRTKEVEAPTESKAEVVQPEAEAPKAETPEAPKPDKPRDVETGKFKKGEDVKAETPAAKPAKVDEPSDPESGLKAGITAERRKRQDAERRATEYQRQLQALQTPRQTPDVLTDPEGFKRSITEENEASRVNDRVNLSADLAREQYPDFDEVMDEWTEMMRENPLIYQQAIKQPNPAKWAYQHVKREKFLKEVGTDPDAWRKAEREKLRSELEPELKKQLESSMPKQPVPPPSLASASSGGRVTSEPTYEGPKPFSRIFGGR